MSIFSGATRYLHLMGIAACSCLFISAANASTVYSYTGQNYSTFASGTINGAPNTSNVPGHYDSSMGISGWFTLANPLSASSGIVDCPSSSEVEHQSGLSFRGSGSFV